MKAHSGVVDIPVYHSDTAWSNRRGRAVANSAAVVVEVVQTTQQQTTHHSDVIPRSEDVLIAVRAAGRTDHVDSLDTRMVSECNKREYDDPIQILSLLAEYVEKFDTGASRCMSGDSSRISHSQRPSWTPVRITGFKGNRSTPTSISRKERAQR
jgi:hypothetical protein